MRYLLAIAVLVAGAMFPLALRAQSVQLISGDSAPAGWARPASFHSRDGAFVPRLRGRSRDVVFPPFFGYPNNYPFTYFYPGLWPPLDYQYQQASRIANGDVAAEVAAQEKAYLSSQVETLINELNSLRQERASRQYFQGPAAQPGAVGPPQASAQIRSRAERKFPATVFIYRDGRQLEARNYAIMGQTLWIFHADTTQKIPLEDFNLPASRKLNEDHGIEFPVPARH